MGIFFSKPQPATNNIDQNTIFIVDNDIDHSQYVLTQLITSHKDAFDKPSVICKYIDDIPNDQQIKLVINTHGGSLANCEKILKKLLNHPAGYVAYIRGECYSAGAIIALGANEIIMNNDSYLGKVDPQSGAQCTIYQKIEEKHIDSHNIYNIISSQYVINYTIKLLNRILDKDKVLNNDNYTDVMSELLYSELPHCALYDSEDCGKMGLSVRVPEDNEKCYFDNSVKISNYKKY